MPLRDHFRPPLDDIRSWDALHGGWPMVITQKLSEILPEFYYAGPIVHLGTVDENKLASVPDALTGLNNPRLPNQDIYEIRIHEDSPGRRLVAAIEIVSPSNKDRPETRGAFVNKVAELLKQDICVSIVDIVSNSFFNLYRELLNYLESTDPALGEEPPPIYVATLRTRYEGRRRMMDDWYHLLSIGGSLPTLPIWLTEQLAVSLDLEASYEVTCRDLRIK